MSLNKQTNKNGKKALSLRQLSEPFLPKGMFWTMTTPKPQRTDDFLNILFMFQAANHLYRPDRLVKEWLRVSLCWRIKLARGCLKAGALAEHGGQGAPKGCVASSPWVSTGSSACQGPSSVLPPRTLLCEGSRQSNWGLHGLSSPDINVWAWKFRLRLLFFFFSPLLSRLAPGMSLFIYFLNL